MKATARNPTPDWTHLPDSLLDSLLDSLSPAEAEELVRTGSQSLHWVPKPGAQAVAFLSDADELFFGGKAGAGKSDLLLGLGLTAHHKTLFLRRQATQLQEVISRVQEVIRPGDRWRGVGYGGVLRTSTGRTLEFAGCDNESDKQKFKGRAHDLKAWDEVVDFPESVYLFVNGWNRTVLPTQRCRIVAASNPPTTAEGEWVIRRWAAWIDPVAGNKAAPCEKRWYTTIDGEERQYPDATPVTWDGITYVPKSRSFIPGEMLDLLIATGYQNTLATLPEPLRSIYLRGDFGATKQDDRWQLIPTRWVLAGVERWKERAHSVPLGSMSCLGVDVAMGGSDETVLAPRHGATIGPLRKARGKDTPDGQSVVDLIIQATPSTEEQGLECPVNIDAIGVGKSAYDVAVLMQLKTVHAIVVSKATDWRDPRVRNIRFANTRSAMMWKVRALLDPEGGPPDSRLAIPPDRKLMADLCAPHYELRVQGIHVESKDEIIERLGRSTDAGDAVGLACWDASTLVWA
jgi:hypothetical protein